MHVILDGSILTRQVASGISNYLANLFKFIKTHETKFGIETSLLLDGAYSQNKYAESVRCFHDSVIINNKLEFLWKMLTGAGDAYRLFHSPYMFLPPQQRRQINLLTVHDLINLERSTSLRNELRKFALLTTIGRSNYFICISKTTKEKFLNRFPNVKENSVRVIYQGIDPIFHSHLHEGRHLTSNTEKPYLLFVGQRYGYKNFDALLDFLKASTWNKKVNLLCVGGGSFTPEEKKKIENFGLSSKVRHAGYIDNSSLINVYKNALCLVYTSLHEGFGIPILEAMASKCPVICANFSSMKEISNSWSISVDDFSTDSLTTALEKATTLDQRFIEGAFEYSRKFSWEKTAMETIMYYSELLES